MRFFPVLTIFAIAVFSIVLIVEYRLTEQKRNYVINSDGRGYYAYLPALFIYNDFTYTKVLEQERLIRQDPNYSAPYKILLNNGKAVNKYFSGVAFLLSPFFGAATLASKISGKPIDGYNDFYQASVSLAALFYLLLGLWWLSRFLKLNGISIGVTAIVLATMFFGTNLLYYSVLDPSMSHVYSFSMVCGFIFFSSRYFKSFNVKYALAAVAVFAIICLIRPVNGILLILLPFLAGNRASLSQGIKTFLVNKKTLFSSAIIFILIINIQCLQWYLQTGKWIVWSYSGEGFYFLQPEVFNVLFSIRKGLFVYTPITGISLAALYFIYKRNRFKFRSIFLFLLICIYVISAWWCWYYGNSFGLRAFIDFYGVFAFLLAIVLHELKGKKLQLMFVACIVTIVLNLLQTYQYTYNILHPFDMTAQKYAYIFLKTDKKYSGILGGNNEVAPFGKKTNAAILSFHLDFEELPAAKTISGRTGKVLYIDSANLYSATISFTAEKNLLEYDALYVKVSIKKSEAEPNATMSAFFAASLNAENNGGNYYWEAFRLSELPKKVYKKWTEINYSFAMPKVGSEDDVVKFFIWNPNRKMFYIDDFEVEIFGVKK